MGIKDFIMEFRTVSISPYIIPTLVRNIREDQESKAENIDNQSSSIPGLMGFFAGVLGVVGQATTYSYLTFDRVLREVSSSGPFYNSVYRREDDYEWNLDHPEVLLLPLATNIASGVYEIMRSKIMRDTKQKLIQNHTKQNLDDVVDNTKQPI